MAEINMLYIEDKQTVKDSIRQEELNREAKHRPEQLLNIHTAGRVRALYLFGPLEKDDASAPFAIKNDTDTEIMVIGADAGLAADVFRLALSGLTKLIVKFTDCGRINLSNCGSHLEQITIDGGAAERTRLSGLQSQNRLRTLNLRSVQISEFDFNDHPELSSVSLNNVFIEDLKLNSEMNHMRRIELQRVFFPSSFNAENARGFFPESCLMKEDGKVIHPAQRREEKNAFLEQLTLACSLIQGNRSYYRMTENEINDGVRDLLTMLYHVKDQSRHGESPAGNDAGEVDLLITRRGETLPFAIGEALILDSMEKEYTDKHIIKSLEYYNPLGYPTVFLLIYSKAKYFSAFWNKFNEYISKYQFPWESLEGPSVIPTERSELKRIRVVLRSGADEHNRRDKMEVLFLAIHLPAPKADPESEKPQKRRQVSD